MGETDGDQVPEARDESDEDGDEVVTRDRGGPPVRLREVILLIVAVIGLVGTVFFGQRWRDLDDKERERDEVTDAAEAFFGAFLEWDATTIDEDFDRILGFAVGEFEQEAQSTFNDDQTREDLRTNRASVRLDGLDTFVRSIEGDAARVFAVADIRAANSEFPQARSDTVRIEIGLQRVDGEWKVSDVNLIDGLSLGLPTPAQ